MQSTLKPTYHNQDIDKANCIVSIVQSNKIKTMNSTFVHIYYKNTQRLCINVQNMYF